MRHLALTPPAYRACLFAVHGSRSRETRSVLDRHFAIERLGEIEAKLQNPMNEREPIAWHEFHNSFPEKQLERTIETRVT